MKNKQDNSELEKEFRALVEEKQMLITAKLNAANQLIEEAIAISEESGVPFDGSVSQISQSYYPMSFRKKFSDLDKDVVENITGTYSEYDHVGWAHSSVC